jgi:phosphate transport system protein
MYVQKEIELLKKEISEMASIAETILDRAISAAETRDEKIILEVIEMDRRLDNCEIRMDAHCAEVLALKDPYALDFRFVFSVIKTTRDLERVGDECKTIAKWSRRLTGDTDPKLIELGRLAREAFHTSVEALIGLDTELAEKVMKIEERVDAIEDQIIESSPDLPRAFIARAFERVSDMATNIAENVIFSVQAKDVRHGGFEKSRQ